MIPAHLREIAEAARRRNPPYEPSGEAWRENLERHGGREYEGGPVCWDACEGICRICRFESLEAPS